MSDSKNSVVASDQMDVVAVIVVHGVADQSRGETVREVAEQLAGASSATVERFDVPMEVPPCDAAVPFKPWESENNNFWSALRVAAKKSLGQSFKSDFLDPQLGGAHSERAVGKKADTTPLRNSAAADPDTAAEPGVRFTDFLLAKAQAKRKASGASNTINNVTGFRVYDGLHRRTDLFEMHWADLSRLSGSMPRILTELFTLLFDLVRLGRNAVAMHGTLFPSEPESMRLLGRLHHWADWLYTRLLAMLMLQVVLCAIFIAMATLLVGHERSVAYLVCGVAGVAAAIVVVHFRISNHHTWTVGALAGSAIAALLTFTIYRAAEVPTGTLLVCTLIPLSWAYVKLLHFWEERFRAVTGFGLFFGAVLLVRLLSGVIWHGGLISINGWIVGTLLAVETFLALLVVSWIALAVLCVMIVVVGSYSGRIDANSDAAAIRRQVIGTGRLGLFASLGTFVVFAMALWAVFSTPLKDAVSQVAYQSFWFDPDCKVDASCFIDSRYLNSTEMFAPIALVLSLMVGFLLIILLPCIAVELSWWKPSKPALIGRWLTTGYRAIEQQLHWWSWAATLVMTTGAALLVASQLTRAGLEAPADLPDLSKWLQGGSTHLLRHIVLTVAGGAAGFLAIGRIAWKRVQALRTPLDAALDVDVHFREFPRDAIPRVRIIERYIALLEYLLEHGYRRIVIIAHSQGSVITADLLRYLHNRRKLFASPEDYGNDRLVWLSRQLVENAGVDLLTVGCPLRQLYATRFPSLYRWVIEPHSDGIIGPKPEALGLRRWFNLWGSADYVGRWLWSQGEVSEPSTLSVDGGAYDLGGKLSRDNWRDECISANAHTHYFELDERSVRAALQTLITT